MKSRRVNGKALALGALASVTAVAVVAIVVVAYGGASGKSPTGASTAASNGPDAPPDATSGRDAFASGGSKGEVAAPGVVQSDAGTGAPAPAPVDSGALALPDVLDRKIVMVSTVSVSVQDVASAFEDVGNIATVDGGFVASSAFGHQDEKETASVTIRVPSDKYEDALGRVRRLGDVDDEQTNSGDVTQEYTDLQSRMRSLQAALQQYLTFLDRAGDIGQVLQVQDRINQTQQDIEQTQGRINLLDNQTDLATITVHLAPVVPAKPDENGGGADNPREAAADAFWKSIDVLEGAAIVVVAVAAFSWWIVPLALAVLYVGRRQLRADRARQPVSPPTQ